MIDANDPLNVHYVFNQVMWSVSYIMLYILLRFYNNISHELVYISILLLLFVLFLLP